MRSFKIPFSLFVFSIFLSISLSAVLAAAVPENNIRNIFVSNTPPHNGGDHNSIHDLNTNFQLYNICKNDIEGFAQKISGGAYSYPSLREDIGDAMISRASTGKMGFEFLTAKVPDNYNKKEVSFFFLSDIDLNLKEPYEIFVNDKSLLTFVAKEDGSLKILKNPGKGKAEYILIKRDGNSDGIGAFRLTIPTHLIKKGEQAKIKVQGLKKGSNSWFMIFKARDVIERLKVSVTTEASFSIKQQGDFLHIDAPGHFENRSVVIESDGMISDTYHFKKQGDLAKVSVKIKAPKEHFKIKYGNDELEITFKNKDGISQKTDIIGKYFYYHNTNYLNGWTAKLTRLYKPSFFEIYKDFFDKKEEDGLISIMNSSHQDIAWVDRPEVCIILRDTLLLTPIIKDAFKRNEYSFDIEDGLMLREYINRHPESVEKITTLLNKKLISVGATYNCPYEDMYDAEDQVRQLYLGKKWVKKTFGGYDSKVYWNVDVPGKTLQYPQILKKAGVDYMVISRHAKGMFYWKSPDGSSVFTYSPGHYGSDLIHLSKSLPNKIKYGAEQIKYWSPYFQGSKTHTPLLSSQDMLPAIDYTDYIDHWNKFDQIKDQNKVSKKIYLPEMKLMTVDKFLPLAEKNITKVDTITGERPNVWVYIHGPAHHDALTASRQASKLIPAAEKFYSVASILDPVKMHYPLKDFDKAWQAKIYPDHGWGGHDGDITDDLFKARLVESGVLGQDLLNKGTSFIASQIKFNEKSGIPVVLFNSLSWNRTDPVKINIELKKGVARSLQIINSQNKKQPSQISNAAYYKDGSIKSAELVFIAKDIPSIGYSTYYLKTSKNDAQKNKETASKNKYENDFYRITLGNTGITQIYDKELKKDLFKTDHFSVGDVFTLQSVGNGAGEFGDIQQPFMKDFDQVSQHHPKPEIIASGDVFTTYRIKQSIRSAIVEQDITIYHKLKRVVFETRLLNWTGELYREFRTAFPIAIENPVIKYEVPFGTVEVGKDEIKTAGERYTPLCKNVHPRAITDWISASDNEMSITLSSSVAVADWIDPTDLNNENLLQHLLLASRTSVHWEGNRYSQEGDHYYNNVLTSNKTGSVTGKRIAKQQNEPIQIVLNPIISKNAFLPQTTSFFKTDKENVIITTIKKAEDNDDYIIRMYDAEGKNVSVDLKSFFKIGNIQHTNIIEENPQPVKEIKVSKYAIETFSFNPK